jgi:hypothetical protein
MLGSKRGFPVMSFRNGFSTELIMQGQIELTQRFNNNGKAYDVPMSIVTKCLGIEAIAVFLTFMVIVRLTIPIFLVFIVRVLELGEQRTNLCAQFSQIV